MKSNYFRDRLSMLAEVRGERAFRKQVVNFAHAMEFTTVTAMLVVDQPFAAPDFHIVDNTPHAYLAAYYEPSFIGVDPVMQHCKRSSQPLVWDQQTYTAHRLGMLWEQQARHGYRTGIALALHFARGRHLFLGLDRDQTIAMSNARVLEIITEMKAFAAAAKATLEGIFLPRKHDIDELNLSENELMVLRFSRDGIPISRISTSTRKSELTLEADLHSAMRKLQCSTKYEAVIEAMRLRII